MRILFTLITILFFSFNNANARYDIDEVVMTKGEVITSFKEEKMQIVVMSYSDKVYKCKLFKEYLSCTALKKF